MASCVWRVMYSLPSYHLLFFFFFFVFYSEGGSDLQLKALRAYRHRFPGGSRHSPNHTYPSSTPPTSHRPACGVSGGQAQWRGRSREATEQRGASRRNMVFQSPSRSTSCRLPPLLGGASRSCVWPRLASLLSSSAATLDEALRHVAYSLAPGCAVGVRPDVRSALPAITVLGLSRSPPPLFPPSVAAFFPLQ